ncbi:MAG TPA: GntR family transcriptional regulator [Gaiellaceae bacterium]|nr:GntR family transcriptional regulator [Gaiellaceae bacterium]
MIVRSTTTLQVEHELRERILDGRLVPGTHLVEMQLAQTLGVSRNTLREALRSLAEQGLVTHHPHRGVEVTNLTEDDVADLFRLRLVLEDAGLAALDAAGAERLREETDAFGDALARGDAIEALEHDFAFHRTIVAALGSARLCAAHERAQGELRIALLQLDRDYEPPQVEEHRAIVEALPGRAARAALRAHLTRAQLRLQHLVTARES